MRKPTQESARNRWTSILPHFIGAELLDGKHHDCPVCGGKKKFRYDDYKGNGEWVCTHGAGNGFDLVQEALGCDFKTAAAGVDKIIGSNNLIEVFQPEVDYEKRRRDLNKLWAGADKPELVSEYLTLRFINDHGTKFKGLTDLRGHDSMYNVDTGKRQPGMCALIRNKKGEPVSIHRTFFDPKAKKIMPPTEKICGAGVRLGWRHWEDLEVETLIVGEGLETTIKGMSDLRHMGLAAISAHGMETLEIPKQFTSIIILADNDRSYTGQKAAFTLARRCDVEKRDVEVIMSPYMGEDYLDMSCSENQARHWSNAKC